jgi:hypothetical protein
MNGTDEEKVLNLLSEDASKVSNDISQTFRDLYLATAALRHTNTDVWKTTVHTLRQIKKVSNNLLTILMCF